MREPSLGDLDALEREIAAGSTFTPSQLAALALRLAALQSTIACAMFEHAVMLSNGKDTAPARMLSADEAAQRLGKPRRWLFAHSRRYAWIKRISRKSLLVDEAAMYRWIASRPR